MENIDNPRGKYVLARYPGVKGEPDRATLHVVHPDQTIETISEFPVVEETFASHREAIRTKARATNNNFSYIDHVLAQKAAAASAERRKKENV